MLRTTAPCNIPFCTFRALDASRRVTVESMGQREVQFNSSERACNMACGNDADRVRDFSAADGFRRDAHAEIRREAQRRTRRRRSLPVAVRSKLQALARARTDTCRLDGRPCLSLRVAPGVGGPQPSGNEGWQGGVPVPRHCRRSGQV
jgi:hypothetical protein